MEDYPEEELEVDMGKKKDQLPQQLDAEGPCHSGALVEHREGLVPGEKLQRGRL